jgi:hypothetical protein
MMGVCHIRNGREANELYVILMPNEKAFRRGEIA